LGWSVGRPELPPGQIAETAQTLKADPNVKAAIDERVLEKRGPDEASSSFRLGPVEVTESIDVNVMRRNAGRRGPYSGRGFIAEKLEIDKPEALPLAGLRVCKEWA
jgi:hypothetical protein